MYCHAPGLPGSRMNTETNPEIVVEMFQCIRNEWFVTPCAGHTVRRDCFSFSDPISSFISDSYCLPKLDCCRRVFLFFYRTVVVQQEMRFGGCRCFTVDCLFHAGKSNDYVVCSFLICTTFWCTLCYTHTGMGWGEDINIVANISCQPIA